MNLKMFFMKNRFFFFVAALFLCSACASRNQGFVVRGSFPGLQDSMVVMLRCMENESCSVVTQGVVRDGAFELRGVVQTPMYCELLFSNQDIVSRPEDVKVGNIFLFLDNSELTLKVPHLDSMSFTSLFMAETAEVKDYLKGSPLQQEFYEYRKALLPLNLVAQKASDSLTMMSLRENCYTPEEYNRLFDEQYPQKQAAEAAIDAAKMEFVRAHPRSLLTLYIAETLLKTPITRAPEEVEELTHVVGQIEDTVRRPYILKIADITRTLCKGAVYKDVELINTTGEKVKLSQFVHPDRYTLVDFWASWCGPCRWAIPKVEQLYKRYGDDRLAVVSVSLDKKREDWEKALKQENMPWTQLGVDGNDMLVTVSRAYHITRIPRLLLIAPDGRVVFSGHDVNALRLTVEKLL